MLFPRTLRNRKNAIHGIGNDVYGNIGLDGRMGNPARLNSIYRARVEYNVDENGQGRVQIRIPELHGMKGDGVPTESLPWAQSLSSSAGAGYGSYMVPEVGEFVMVQFENGDPYKPVVLGSVYGSGPLHEKEYGSGSGDDEKWESKKGEKEVPSENLRSSPSLKTIYKSPTGAVISVDEAKGSEGILIGDGLGQHIKISTNMNSSSTRKGPSAHRDSDGTSIEIKDFGGQSLVMSASKEKSKITLTSTDGYSLSIDPKDDGFRIKANESEIHINKDGSMKVYGKQVDIEADSMVKLHSKKSTMQVDSDVVLRAPGNVFIESGQDMHLKADGQITIIDSVD